jgi:hypothetical protein
MKKTALLPLLLLLAGLLNVSAAHAAVLAYPTPDNASFLIDVPDDWAVEAAGSRGDYAHVNSDSGVYLAVRTIEASEFDPKAAAEDAFGYLQENYKDVQLGDGKETQQAGMSTYLVSGTGKESDGTLVVFGMAWVRLKDGTVGEVWFAAPLADEDGISKSRTVLGSFRAP